MAYHKSITKGNTGPKIQAPYIHPKIKNQPKEITPAPTHYNIIREFDVPEIFHAPNLDPNNSLIEPRVSILFLNRS
jgi:hypothetical protein